MHHQILAHDLVKHLHLLPGRKRCRQSEKHDSRASFVSPRANWVAINHAASGVTASTYGSTTVVPVLTVDAQGHITAAANSANINLNLFHAMTSGTTSATTFKMRVGAGNAGTLYMNGCNGAGLLGGVLRSGLVVMGCYGHSRLTELVFGGATRHVLSNLDRAVLLSH